MRYLRVQWIHPDADEPIELYSELDDEGWETRKVELFRDGTLGFAESIESAGTTELGETPLPSLEEIAANPEFRPTWIPKEEFERAWSKRLSQVVHASRSSSGEGSKGDEFTPN